MREFSAYPTTTLKASLGALNFAFSSSAVALCVSLRSLGLRSVRLPTFATVFGGTVGDTDLRIVYTSYVSMELIFI